MTKPNRLGPQERENIMATVKLVLDTRRAKKDGTYPVRIRIQHKGKILISTGFSAKEENWCDGEFNANEKNYRAKNIVLRDMANKAEKVIYGLYESGKIQRTSDSQLKEEVEKQITMKAHVSPPFIHYLDEFVSKKRNQGTISVYATTRNKIQEYDARCTLDSMDVKWLKDFEKWMQEEGMKINAYAIHLRNIRAIFNYCIDEGYTQSYPFRKFKIKREETRKRALTVEQLRILRDYPCEQYQERYRDMFMLMFYLVGINAEDLFLAKKTDVSGGRLEYKRAKTGRLYSMKIEPEAQEIIDRYSGNEYLLNSSMDDYSDYKDFLHRMNIALKQIGMFERKGRGGKKIRKLLFDEGISSYWSRHTWATIAAELDVPKETISEALGHSLGSSVTSIYIKFDRKKIDEANRRVIDYVNEE